MTHTPVTVTLTELEWESLIYNDRLRGCTVPHGVVSHIETCIAEQVNDETVRVAPAD